MDARDAAVIAAIPILAGATEVIELSGGLTNRNLRVVCPNGVYVVRCSSSDAGLLGIDRDAEAINSARAFDAGVGAEVVSYHPELGALVIGFLQGVTLSDDSFADPEVLGRAADAVRRLHAGAQFQGDFNMFTRRALYRKLIAENGFWLPPAYDDFAAQWTQVESALAANPRPSVPCNNDLLAGNYLDDGHQVWLIDYEYSGNNDACFELGNTATECEFTPEMTDAWTEAYFGPLTTKADIARVRLQALCSAYGWALWGFIQAGSSSIDYDFTEWGSHRFEKAAAIFRGPDFTTLLKETAGAS